MATLLESNRRQIHVTLPLLEKNSFWVAENLEELRKEYPDQYIAVKGRKVIESARTRKELLEKLEHNPDADESVAIEFIGSKNMKFLV